MKARISCYDPKMVIMQMSLVACAYEFEELRDDLMNRSSPKMKEFGNLLTNLLAQSRAIIWEETYAPR